MNILVFLEKKVGSKTIKIRIGTLLLSTLALSVLILMFGLYRHTTLETRKFFSQQYNETVKSNLQTIKSKFREQMNFLSYELNSSIGTLPKGVNTDKFLFNNLRKTISSREYIRKVYLLDFINRKCFLYFPRLDTISQPLNFIDFHGLRFNKGKISKNFMYIYNPDHATEKVDSVIWGLISIPIHKVVKGKPHTIGLVFILIDASALIDQLSRGTLGENAIMLRLAPLELNDTSDPRSVRLIWDNSQLDISYRESIFHSKEWRVSYKGVRKIIMYAFLLAGGAVLFAFIATIYLHGLMIKMKDREVDESENERKILDKAAYDLESKVETTRPEDLMLKIVGEFEKKSNVAYIIAKNGIIIAKSTNLDNENAGALFNEKGGCDKEDPQNSSLACKEIELDQDRYKILIKGTDDFNAPKKHQFYLIFLRMLELAAKFSFRSLQKREIEENIFLTILKILGAKDNYTCDHSLSVAEIAAYIGEKIGKVDFGLTDYDVNVLRMSGYLHDIGKIGIPDEILNKLGKYREIEITVMRQHPLYTKAILEPLAAHIKYYRDVMNIAVHHHERLDGSGYPFGLKGKDFTIPMQILAIADSLDAMMRDRPYKKAKNLDEVRDDLSNLKDRKFNAKLVKEILKILEEIYEIPKKRRKEHCKIEFL